jgi:GTPase Era involved in 16S rRNA processing
MSTAPNAPLLLSAEGTRLELLARLTRLQEVAVGESHAQKLRLLGEKLRNDQSVLAFCGHFSAGKSTLINRLAGSQILPASPIPTSANQVLIRHGAPGATVRFRQRGQVVLPPSDLHQLAALCANGDEVEAVEIRHPLVHVPDGVWMMDTPGIDSTDEAHRTVTESALYFADAVFYVMDYNHVQSAVNLQFTRTLADWGKPFYLIINQIDKHVEMEIPFAKYRQSVMQAFAAWGVHPNGLFFISLREPNHELNEWDSLLETIQVLSRDREQLLVSGIWKSAVHLMAEEERQCAQAAAGRYERLSHTVAEAGPDPVLRQAVVAAEVERLTQVSAAAVQLLNRELGTILKNAPIFPFTTKELADRYLDARKPNFRVGLFSSAGKTKAEVERRLSAFHVDLLEKVTAHIQWHVKERLVRFGEHEIGRDEGYEAAVRATTVAIDPALLADLVKPQSLTASEYRLQYIQDVTAEIQLRYRREIRQLVERASLLVSARTRRDQAPLRAEQTLLVEAQAAAQELSEMSDSARNYRGVWSEILGQNPAPGPAASRDEAIEIATVEKEEAPRPLEITHAHQAGAPSVAPAILGQAVRADAADRLRQAARLLAPLPGMARAAVDLEQRAERLTESRFTVALFGAFSAGKSSFANALMGIQLLPVSPNPTTAVITRIVPPTPKRPHGYVHVLWKSQEQLRQEVERALSALGLPATGVIATDLATGSAQSRAATAPSAKAHAAFLLAASIGYGAVRHCLGLAEQASFDQFASLVSDEQRACFVAEITVYVDCPVTRLGITLVDTPGADSINARHTDVAFDYIKNADAVLFVTYYNHAFAHADRDFLTQLGRVKDSFALDKMFFLINAADLALDESELESVTAHVRKNLLACGIRQAKIFPVSSQTALWSRLQGAAILPVDLTVKLQKRLGVSSLDTEILPLGLRASGMERFEQEFYRFVVTDLSQMAIDSAFTELRRSTQTIAGWLEAAREDEGARARRLLALRGAQASAEALISALDVASEATAVDQEIDELLYYVRRRVLQERFRDGFVQAFNSSVLRQDSPDIKRALREALHEMTEFVRFDLSQEMRAISLLVENSVNRQAERVGQRAAALVNQHLTGWSEPPYTPFHLPIPTFSDGRDLLRPEPFQKLLGLFRNPEWFFAGGGRDQLLEELGKALEEPVDGYLSGARTNLAEWYGNAFSVRVLDLKAALIDSVEDHARGLSAALSGAAESQHLESILQHLHTHLGIANT